MFLLTCILLYAYVRTCTELCHIHVLSVSWLTLSLSVLMTGDIRPSVVRSLSLSDWLITKITWPAAAAGRRHGNVTSPPFSSHRWFLSQIERRTLILVALLIVRSYDDDNDDDDWVSYIQQRSTTTYTEYQLMHVYNWPWARAVADLSITPGRGVDADLLYFALPRPLAFTVLLGDDDVTSALPHTSHTGDV